MLKNSFAAGRTTARQPLECGDERSEVTALALGVSDGPNSSHALSFPIQSGDSAGSVAALQTLREVQRLRPFRAADTCDQPRSRAQELFVKDSLAFTCAR